MLKEQLKHETETTPVQKAIKLMESIETKYETLSCESEEALFEHRDKAGYQEKSIEAANLIVALPIQLKAVLQDDQDAQQISIIRRAEGLAITAKQLLDSKRFAGMASILNDFDTQDATDKNQLEKMIDELKRHDMEYRKRN